MAIISCTPLRIAGSSFTVFTSSFLVVLLTAPEVAAVVDGEEDIDIFLNTDKPEVGVFGLAVLAEVRDGLDWDFEMAPLLAEERLFTLIFIEVKVKYNLNEMDLKIFSVALIKVRLEII